MSTSKVVLTSAHLNYRCGLESWETKKRLVTDHLLLIAQKWKLHGLVQSKDNQFSTLRFLTHIIKRGDTLTSISRQYGVSIQTIVAANLDIVNVGVILEGDHLIIPASAGEINQEDSSWRIRISHIDSYTWQTFSKITSGLVNHNIAVMASHHLEPVKSTAYLLLVTLIAVCIKYLVGMFRRRLTRSSKRRDTIAKGLLHGLDSGNSRWKTALRDIREPEDFDSESRKYFVEPLEDQLEAPFEDVSGAYTDLNPAYQKFLSECGMSNKGYWRGGGSSQ